MSGSGPAPAAPGAERSADIARRESGTPTFPQRTGATGSGSGNDASGTPATEATGAARGVHLDLVAPALLAALDALFDGAPAGPAGDAP